MQSPSSNLPARLDLEPTATTTRPSTGLAPMRPVTQSNMVKSQPKTSNTSTFYLTHKINGIRPPYGNKCTATPTQPTKIGTEPFQPNPTPQQCTTQAESCGNSKNRATKKKFMPGNTHTLARTVQLQQLPNRLPTTDDGTKQNNYTEHQPAPATTGRNQYRRSQTTRQQTDGIKELQQQHSIGINLQPPAGTNTEQTIATRQQTDGSTTADIDRAGQASNQQYATTGILMDLQPPADNPQSATTNSTQPPAH